MDIVLKVLPALLEGTKMTILVFALTLLFSLPIGMLLGFLATGN